VDPQGLESCTAFDSWDQSVQTRTSATESFDLGEYLHIDLLTEQTHEPHCFPPSEISQSTDGALAENPQSQSRPSFTLPDVSHPSLIPGRSDYRSNNTFNSGSQRFSSVSTPSSLERSPSHSTTVLSNSCGSEEAANSKRRISLAHGTYSCLTCKDTFSNEAGYRKHRRHANCTASSPKPRCSACERVFTLSKDLKRHQVHGCPASKSESRQLKLFTCSCGERAYPRKDSLQRHIRNANTQEHSQRHKCNACKHCQCRC
jgi:hypothetical protein